MDALIKVRSLLEAVTPLARDCGALCGGACCESPEEGDEELGMLLFPGEEGLYGPEDAKWMRIVPSGVQMEGKPVPLLVCDGTCPRDKRPLSCRIFPLAPKFRDGQCLLQMDTRGGAICPLCDSGAGGLQPEFRQAVEEAFAALMQDARQAAFLCLVDEQIRQHRRMLRLFF